MKLRRASKKRFIYLVALIVFPFLIACLSIYSIAAPVYRASPPAPSATRTTTSSLTSTPTRAPEATSTITLTPTPVPSLTPAPTLTDTPIPASTATAAPLTVSVVEIPAPSLKENLIGEPDVQAIQVYLPPSYASSQKRYPVVYFLPGFGSDRHGNNNYFAPEQLASLMAGGQIKEMILILPTGANLLQGSFYVNSPVTGNWEDFIIQDVLNYIDSNYRTIASAEGRGISGHSMGGFGALNLAMRHPDLFSASYSLSPALFDENGLSDSQMFDKANKPAALMGRLAELDGLSTADAIRKMKHFEGYTGFTVAYGAAFAPDPELGPPFFDFPFQNKNGEAQRIPTVWRLWESGLGGWPEKIAEYHENLASLRGIVFDYGIYDGMQWIPRGTEYLSKLLTEAGIPNQIYRFEGKHGDRVGERMLNVLLPFFSEVLADSQ